MHRWTSVVILAAAAASAQTRPAPAAEPTGNVTGHVFCADTNEPARFAHVSLEAVAKPGSPTGLGTKSTSFANGETTSVETTVDGSFLFPKVKPGDYFVIVTKQGYINPRALFTQKEIDDPAPEMRALVERALPRVHVDANQTPRTEVSLQRGGAVSGTILYDDGSPAGELSVRLLHKDDTGKWVGLKNSYASTDDRGNFRIASLLADKYMIEADLTLGDTRASSMSGGPGGESIEFQMMRFRFSLPFYGSGFARQRDAASFELTAGEELPGQSMTIPISKLRRLSGRVAAGADGHFVNAAGLSLVTRDDGKELASADISREDGLFHFEFVPDGDYVLKVTDARDVAWDPPTPTKGAPASPFSPEDKERVLQSFGSTEMPVLLSGDLLTLVVTVPPDTKADPPKSGPNP